MEMGHGKVKDFNLETATFWNAEELPVALALALLFFNKDIRYQMKEGLLTTGQGIGKAQ